MFEKLDIFRMSHAMAVHAGQKQAVAAQNVANADTPDYKARDVIPFAESFRNDDSVIGGLSQRATRGQHMHGAVAGQMPDPIIDRSNPEAPNGNTVSLESEMLKSLDAKRQHDRAIAIYKSSMTILRATLSRS
ncbi:FlgB family protein [uncultured Roseobacter sp.]|uniref:FlgB family protein n=1 Tax=uncultured Roseobacter sp. TaxID=114847 RepID=UPI00260AF09B|nr:FlgB family protein [uncultured Roseobacter sp.]